MITDDEVLRLFERADPARGQDSEPRLEAAVYLDLLRSTERQVVLVDAVEERSAEPTVRRWRPLVVAAAAALAVFAAAVVVESRQDSSEPATNVTPTSDPTTAPVTTTEPVPTTEPSTAGDATAIEVAQRFLTAYAAFDAHGASSYLADDADIAPIVTSGGDKLEGTPENFRLWLLLMKAEGYEQSRVTCEQRQAATLAVVRCGFDFDIMGSDALGLGPFKDSYFDFIIGDGKISKASLHWGLDEFSPRLWTPFGDWMAETYPEDTLVMFDPTRSYERLTFESIELWDQHVDEYVQAARQESEDTASAFMLAYGAFDADSAIGYLADGADLVDILNGGGVRGVYGNREEFRLWLTLLQAEQYQQTLNSCDVQSKTASAGIRVRCSYDFHVLGSHEIGLEPFEGSYIDLNVLNGEIIRAVGERNGAQFPVQMWIPFADWMTTTYPDDAAVMYDATFQSEQLTPESIYLWQEHTADYIQHVLSSPAP